MIRVGRVAPRFAKCSVFEEVDDATGANTLSVIDFGISAFQESAKPDNAEDIEAANR
jgi:hypothetical protein